MPWPNARPPEPGERVSVQSTDLAGIKDALERAGIPIPDVQGQMLVQYFERFVLS